jgi:hypothetical protein
MCRLQLANAGLAQSSLGQVKFPLLHRCASVAVKVSARALDWDLPQLRSVVLNQGKCFAGQGMVCTKAIR